MTNSRAHYYKGWSFRQHARSRWGLLRLSDGFMTWHNSYQGCRSFIRQHGQAANPDQSYELALVQPMPSLTHA
jgi:hypothetical protein